MKAWKLYDPILRKVVVSRDVFFEEEAIGINACKATYQSKLPISVPPMPVISQTPSHMREPLNALPQIRLQGLQAASSDVHNPGNLDEEDLEPVGAPTREGEVDPAVPADREEQVQQQQQQQLQVQMPQTHSPSTSRLLPGTFSAPGLRQQLLEVNLQAPRQTRSQRQNASIAAEDEASQLHEE